MGNYNEFIEEYNNLHKAEKWTEIIEQAELLVTTSMSAEELTRIYMILAKANHHIGQYEKTITYAKEAIENADNDELRAESNYLASAGYRNKFDRNGNNKEDLRESEKYILQSLTYLKSEEVSNECKAKINFNAAAFYHDAAQDFDKASKYYQDSLELVSQNNDFYFRITIRDARLDLEKDDIESALTKITEVKPQIEKGGDKTKVHCAILEAKIALKQKRYNVALDALGKAKDIAANHGMSGDLKLIDNLNHSVNVAIRDEIRAIEDFKNTVTIFDINGTVVANNTERVVERLHYLFGLIADVVNIPKMPDDFVSAKDMYHTMIQHFKNQNITESDISNQQLIEVLAILDNELSSDLNIDQQKENNLEQLAFYIHRAYKALTVRERDPIHKDNLKYSLPQKAVVEGVDEVISFYKNQGAVMFATNDYYSGTNRNLTELHLYEGELITTNMLICADQLEEGEQKPNVAHFEKAIKKAGVKDFNQDLTVNVIGDSLVDAITARDLAAKHKNILVTTIINTQTHKIVNPEEIEEFRQECKNLGLENFELRHINNFSEMELGKNREAVTESIQNRAAAEKVETGI